MAKSEKGVSLTNHVYRQLRDRMMALELKSGTRLLEDEIAAELEVGRTPVREALLRLQGEGLLERSGGWVVREIDPAAIVSVFECRMAIEGYATRLAATRASAVDAETLGEIVKAMDGSLSHAEETRLNRLFHETIIQISGNGIFSEMYERTQFPYWNLRTPIVIFSEEDRRRITDCHREILETIREHCPDRAEELAREHVENTLRIVRRIFV